MTDDPDELRYEHEIRKKDPAAMYELMSAIEVHLHYGIPALKRIGWLIVILLGLILWRLWP